jgi:hypothetical protein
VEEPDDDYDDEETGEGLMARQRKTIILPSETTELFDELKELISAKK